jgi:adenosylcobinamide-GDP ribazoletransferase
VPDQAIRRPLRALAIALGFLTRLPIRQRTPPQAGELVGAATLFPLVGAALGGLVGGAAVGLAQLVPALLAAALAIALELALTGALHVDGLADSADGLAGRDPERALAIMRDHALGAYGGSALALDLLVKAAALAALAESTAVLPVVAAFAVSRAAPLPLAAALPYGRAGAGTGRLLAERLPWGRALAGLALAVVVALAAAGAWALASLACLALVTAVVGLLALRRLGGVTGDVMGAAIELTATLALVVAAGALG